MITSRLVSDTGSSRRTWALMSTDFHSGPAVTTAYSNGRRGPGRSAPASARITCPLSNCHLARVTGAQFDARGAGAIRTGPAGAAAKVLVPVTFQILPLALARRYSSP